MQLYELPAAHEALMKRIDDAEGEIDPLTEISLLTLDNLLTAAVEGICKAIRNAEGEASMIRAEASRLIEAARVAENKRERLLAYLKRNLDLLGINKVKGELFSVTVCRNSRPTIFAADPENVPDEYKVRLVRADGEKAYKTWKETGSVPAGFTCELGWHLRIR